MSELDSYELNELIINFTREYINHLGKNTYNWLEQIKPKLTFTDKEEDRDKLNRVYMALSQVVMELRSTVIPNKNIPRDTSNKIEEVYSDIQIKRTFNEIIQILRKNT